MLEIVNKALTGIFGSKEKKDIKRLQPYVDEINEEFAKLDGLSDDELRGKTKEIKAEIDTYLQHFDDEIASIKKDIEERSDIGILEKEGLYERIDELEEERNEELEIILMKMLPKAFAVVKETARRYKDKDALTVNAEAHDTEIAAIKDYVSIKGDTAEWSSTWTVADNPTKWNMVHYDVQLMGGIVLHEGKIAEMATGEGKTLVATLPAYLNALASRGVHIITVNDYLAKRDAQWMAPIFEFHGLTVDCIDHYQPHSDERKAAYLSDITYGTNNEFGFDYLRDNMVHSTEDIVQRKLHFTMVDEVDSVLIDDARTPLIISGPIGKTQNQEYEQLKPRVAKLVEQQRVLVRDLLNEAKQKIKNGKEKEAGLPLFRAYRGLPKYKPLIKFLSEQGNKVLMQKTENYYLQDNAKMMPEADEVLYFSIDEKNNAIELTEKGLEAMTGSSEDPNFFILPDISTGLKAIDDDPELSDKEKLEKKNELTEEYKEKSQRIHSVNQLLKANTLFEKDTDYIVANGKVQIVDEQTGRVMEGRRYSDGLHQALEAKESVKIEEATQTYATVTLQNYFRMYHKLSGMTGTAVTEAGEFWEIYKLDVVVVPTNVPIIRDDRQDKIYKTIREKYNAVVEEIVEMTKQGRPVLVGTTSVENSEILSKMLRIRSIDHQVLNAKQHQKEAEIVTNAGKPGAVTIATNMAGRGTDIKLHPDSKAAGGLAIVGTERHESRRIDRQLRGRAGRQGDPGSSQFYVSLEDNLMRLFVQGSVAKVMDRMGLEEGEVIQHSMITKSIERAQKKVEENNFGIRKRLLEYDDVMNSQRELIYKKRKNALYGDRLGLDVMNMVYETAENLVYNAADYEAFLLNTFATLNLQTSITNEQLEKGPANEVAAELYKEAMLFYKEKNTNIAHQLFPLFQNIKEEKGDQVENIILPVTDGKRRMQMNVKLDKALETQGEFIKTAIERSITLAFIDQEWKEHLREMDDLKHSVQNATYEQKDPLLIYKFEALELFKQLINRLNEETLSFLFRAGLPSAEEDIRTSKGEAPQRTQPKVRESKEEMDSILQNRPAVSQQAAAAAGGNPNQTAPPPKPKPAKSKKIANRNERVTVRYTDGAVKKDVKFKHVEADIKNNKCVLVDEA